MAFDPTKDIPDHGRSAPARRVAELTAAQLSDTADLTSYAKALRVWNGSGATVTLKVQPLLGDQPVRITVPDGAAGYEPIGVRRVLSTGSTGLAAGLAAGTVQVLLLTE